MRIPGALDPDDAGLEVDVALAERQQLAEPESGVERGRPDGPVLFAYGSDQGLADWNP